MIVIILCTTATYLVGWPVDLRGRHLFVCKVVVDLRVHELSVSLFDLPRRYISVQVEYNHDMTFLYMYDADLHLTCRVLYTRVYVEQHQGVVP